MGLFTSIKDKYNNVKEDIIYNNKVRKDNKILNKLAERKGKELARKQFKNTTENRFIDKAQQAKNTELERLTNPPKKKNTFTQGLNNISNKLGDTFTAAQENETKRVIAKRKLLEAQRRLYGKQKFVSPKQQIINNRQEVKNTIRPEKPITKFGPNDTYDPRYYQNIDINQPATGTDKIRSILNRSNSNIYIGNTESSQNRIRDMLNGNNNFSQMLGSNSSNNSNKLNSFFNKSNGSSPSDKIKHFLR